MFGSVGIIMCASAHSGLTKTGNKCYNNHIAVVLPARSAAYCAKPVNRINFTGGARNAGTGREKNHAIYARKPIEKADGGAASEPL